VGGAVAFSPNFLLYLNQASSYMLGLNGFSRKTTQVPFQQQARLPAGEKRLCLFEIQRQREREREARGPRAG
jgi:hypothetical protein